MASGHRRLYSLAEVIADMDEVLAIPGPLQDDDTWSDDDFEGYISEDEQCEGADSQECWSASRETMNHQCLSQEREQSIEASGNMSCVDIGAECEVEETGVYSQIPQYAYRRWMQSPM